MQSSDVQVTPRNQKVGMSMPMPTDTTVDDLEITEEFKEQKLINVEPKIEVENMRTT